MKALRTRCIVMLALAGLAPACGTRSDDPEGASENASAPLTPITSVDFESYPPGPLGAPWSVSQMGASAISIATTADHGKVLAHGSGTSSDFLTAAFPFTAADPLLHVQVDVKPAGGATFIFDIKGARSSLSARRVRLQRSPGSNALVASSAGTTSGNTVIAELPFTSTAPALTLGLASNQRQARRSSLPSAGRGRASGRDGFVRINGAATARTGSTTEMSAPFTSVSVMDASNAGFGGDVDFDDVLAKASTESTCGSP